MIRYFVLLISVPLFLHSYAIVFTTAFNRPDFIELQHRLFEHFLLDEYEFWVVCDANSPEMRITIEDTCKNIGANFLQVPQEIHDRPYLFRSPGDNFNNPNVRHCNSVQWAWDHFFSQHDGPVMIIDSDMFLIRPFSISSILENKHLAGVFWGTEDTVSGKAYSYLWLALMILNNPHLPEKESLCFNCGVLPGTQAVCDSGGWTSIYLNKHKGILKIHNLSFLQGHQFYCPYRYAPPDLQDFDHITEEEKVINLRSRGFTENEINLALQKPYTIELLGDNHFLHYRAGTNYENYSNQFLSEKDKTLINFINSICCY